MLLLTPRFWPEVRRGTERTVHLLAGGLAQRGHDVLVVTSAAVPGRGTEEGVRVLRLPRLPLAHRYRGEADGHAPFLHAALRAVRADVVHAFHVGDAAVAVAQRRTPVVWTHMGIPDRADLTQRRGREARTERVLSCAAAVTVVSRHSAAAMEATSGHAPHVVHPAVNLDLFVPGARSHVPLVVCAAAADEPRKRVAMLVAAWPVVRRARPDARLWLLGRGVEALGALPDGVEAVATEDTTDLARLNAAAWAAALPSTDDSFGIVLAEALAAGTPVVASDAGALPEVVDRPEIGRLFAGGPDELARAILEVLDLAEQPGTRDACRRRAGDFSVDRMVDAYLAVYP